MNHLMKRVFAEPHKFHDYTSGGFVPPLTMPNDSSSATATTNAADAGQNQKGTK
jgi:hypothetical protein